MKPSTFEGTYAEWYQTVEKPRLEAIPANVRVANFESHRWGIIDNVDRCIDCEIGIWNGWHRPC